MAGRGDKLLPYRSTCGPGSGKGERFDLLAQDSGPGYVSAFTTGNKTYKGEYGRGVNSPGRE